MSIFKNKNNKYGEAEAEKSLGAWIKFWLSVMFILLILVALSLRIKTVKVIGNSTYTEAEVEGLVFDKTFDYNPIYCFITSKFFEHKELPFIEDYDIRFHSPFSCDLIVYEKSIVGYVNYMSSYMYFDSDGIIVESSTERIEGVPEVTGLKFGHIVLNQKLPTENEEVFSEIMNITQQLDTHSIKSDRIDFNGRGEAKLALSGGNIAVDLGENENIDAKILALSDMLPQIVERGLKGTLDLSSYNESDEKVYVSFKLDSENT